MEIKLVDVRRDFLSIQEDGGTREPDMERTGAGAVAGLVREEGSGGTPSAVDGRVMVEHLSPREDPCQCLQGVRACVCGGGRLGRERRWVIAGQQSSELVKLQVTLNPPLEAQREFQEHDLEPPEDSSEGKDFRDWGVWLSDPFSIP